MIYIVIISALVFFASVGGFFLVYKINATTQSFVAPLNAADAIIEPVVEVVPVVDEATEKYFKQLASFDWDFNEKYKFERNRKNYLRDRQQELFNAANTEMLKTVCRAFQDYHWMNSKKPKLSDFAVLPKPLERV